MFLALREVAALPDQSARLAELLDRLDFVWRLATERTYLNKRGKPVKNPDHATQVKVIEVAADLVGAKAQQQNGAGNGLRPVDLSIFNGGADKKAG